MILTIVIVSAIAIVVGGVLIAISDEILFSVTAFLLGVGLVVIGAIGFISGGCLIKDWYGAKYEADIINREYNTSYTQEEVFFAKDVIDTIRQIDRTRIELQGLPSGK